MPSLVSLSDLFEGTDVKVAFNPGIGVSIMLGETIYSWEGDGSTTHVALIQALARALCIPVTMLSLPKLPTEIYSLGDKTGDPVRDHKFFEEDLRASSREGAVPLPQWGGFEAKLEAVLFSGLPVWAPVSQEWSGSLSKHGLPVYSGSHGPYATNFLVVEGKWGPLTPRMDDTPQWQSMIAHPVWVAFIKKCGTRFSPVAASEQTSSVSPSVVTAGEAVAVRHVTFASDQPVEVVSTRGLEIKQPGGDMSRYNMVKEESIDFSVNHGIVVSEKYRPVIRSVFLMGEVGWNEFQRFARGEANGLSRWTQKGDSGLLAHKANVLRHFFKCRTARLADVLLLIDTLAAGSTAAAVNLFDVLGSDFTIDAVNRKPMATCTNESAWECVGAP